MNEPMETYRGVVYPWHCDHMGHMNVMWYTGKFDEATWTFFSALGITPSYLRDRKRGMVAVEQKIAYQRELLAGDPVLVRSRLLEVRAKVIRFQHQMIKVETGELAATSELTGVHIDRSARRACALPAPVIARARRLLAPGRQSTP